MSTQGQERVTIRQLPTGVPGLKFQFNLSGPDQRIRFDLDVGQFLPRQWGFH